MEKSLIQTIHRSLTIFSLFWCVVFSQIAASHDNQTCHTWFSNTGISPSDPQCINMCVSASVGLGTFSCPSDCEHFCGPVEEECDLDELPALTDPDAIAFENGNRINTGENFNLNTEMNCLTGKVTNLGGSSTLNSAYRPASYQQHLRDVWDHYERARDNDQPQCQERRTEIENEFNNHNLRFRPAATSSHSSGNAFDLSINGLTDQQIDTAADECGLQRPLPVRDPVHFTPE